MALPPMALSETETPVVQRPLLYESSSDFVAHPPTLVKGSSQERDELITCSTVPRPTEPEPMPKPEPEPTPRPEPKGEGTLPVLGVDLVAAARRSRGPLAGLAVEQLISTLEDYRRFLFLVSLDPSRRLIPTGGIDEMWHLHMLHPVAYLTDCMAIFGFLLDHDPGFGETQEESPVLIESAARTAELWEATFGSSSLDASRRAA